MIRHPKNNIRSFRFSNEVAKILEDHNYDLEALVLECYYTLPEVEKQLDELTQAVMSRREELYNLGRDIRNLQHIKKQISNVERSLDNLLTVTQNFQI